MTDDLSDKIKTNPFGGWLILVQIILFLLIFGRLNDVQVFYGLLGEEDKLLKTQGITDPHLYTAFIYTELISGAILLLFAFILVYLFFKRIKYFPMLMIIFIIIDQLTEAAVYYLFHSLAQSGPFIFQKLIFGILIGLLIIFYLVMSNRVKLTFTKNI
jgi:hypothetical protein